ncbi:MAG TPA: protein kinase [Gemmataceae bacterium]|nr:protein kinase [Gemmataceae bacterium]
MTTTELGACEWFVWDLRRSNLLDRGQLDQIVGEYLNKHPDAEPPALADFLVNRSILTRFQADRLLQGKTQGFVLGPFTLMDALGQGSMGTVYKALSKTDGKWYAVKVLPRRSMWNVRLARRKVRQFEQCKHPAVVPFVDVGTAGGMHYLAWPMVEGETLEKTVQQRGKLPSTEAVAYVVQALEGLETCHAQGLFHGLLKPSNLMIGPDGQLRILDLGIGCLLAESEGESLVDTMSTANSVASGLDCASPESIMDPTNLTVFGDQYSLGCVLYFCVSGQFPFPDGTAVEKMMAHQTKQPPSIQQLCPGLSADLAAVIERLMQKEPSARYASTAEALSALRPFAGATPAQGRQPLRAASAHPGKPAAPLGDVPRPLGKAAIPPAPSIPAVPRAPSPVDRRPTTHPRAGLPEAPPVARPKSSPAAPPSPPAQAPHTPSRLELGLGQDARLERSWEERLGPVGIAVFAIVACAIAWFVTYKFF